ncbi:hypothetical protein AAV833_14380, partial [Geobacillus stearothermophilus]
CSCIGILLSMFGCTFILRRSSCKGYFYACLSLSSTTGMILFIKMEMEGLRMREEEFRNYLINNSDIKSKVKAVNSRVSRALMVEREFNVNLDDVVKNDEAMYHLLLQIQEKFSDKLYHGNYQNAVRKYYLFVNGKEFPRLKQYEKTRGIYKHVK